MIRIRNASVSLLALQPDALEPAALAAALAAHPALAELTETLPIVVDLTAVSAPSADWAALRGQLEAARLQPVGVRNGDAGLRAAAVAAGWADLGTTAPNLAAARPAEAPATPAVAPQPAAQPAAAAPRRAMLIDKPIRSGQKLYARGADAVVLAMVSPGAEIIADGSIHVYAPLRGRALAGALGDTEARIYALSFEPELVSIAGVWRNFAEGHGDVPRGQPTQVRLAVDNGHERLAIEPLTL